VFAALIRAGTGRTALHRFANCGSGAVVERGRNGEYRVRANYCRSRWCRPCAAARAAALADTIATRLAGRTFRFLTLTLRSSSTPLTDQLSRLIRCFRELRRSRLWRQTVTGSIAVIEITRNNGRWHPHLHVLILGNYVDQAQLAQRWHAITGDSFVVWIRRPPEGIADYIAKYASKGTDNSVESDDDAFTEAIRALSGRRLIITTGELYGAEKADQPTAAEPLLLHGPPEPYWTVIGTLTRIIDNARRGDPEAVAILKALGYEKDGP